MTTLSVNLNVAALLRNRREHAWPDVVDLGRIALKAGALGLTVHPRPDQRHTRPSDVRNLRAMLDHEFPDCELNVEGYPDSILLALALEVRAEQVTLVPDTPGQPTSDHGWDFVKDQAFLKQTVTHLKANGHRVALFANADADQMLNAAGTGTDRVELYTGPFGSSYDVPIRQKAEIERIKEAASKAIQHGMAVNAGHDLTVAGTTLLVTQVPEITEISIGHALFCDALTFGMTETVRRFVAACTNQPK